MSTLQSPWDLAGRIARVRHERAVARVDLEHPELGFQLQQFGDQPLRDCQLLGVELGRPGDAPPPDGYVREGDLVATYAPTESLPRRVQTYWRLHEAQDRLVLDLQVSVQTPLLDALPRVQVVTRLPQSRLWSLEGPGRPLTPLDRPLESPAPDFPPYVLVTQPAGITYIELIHPDDFGGFAAEIAEGVSWRHSLFGDSLEKGVILRARLRSLWMPAVEDPAAAATAAFIDFLSDPLPLST